MRIDQIDARRLLSYLPVRGGWITVITLILILCALAGTEWWAYANRNAFAGLIGWIFHPTLFINVLHAVSRAEFNGGPGTGRAQPMRWLREFWKRNVVGHTLICTLDKDDMLTWRIVMNGSEPPPCTASTVSARMNLVWGTCRVTYPSGCVIDDPNYFDLSLDHMTVMEGRAIAATVTMRDVFRRGRSTNPMPIRRALQAIRRATEPQHGRAAR